MTNSQIGITRGVATWLLSVVTRLVNEGLGTNWEPEDTLFVDMTNADETLALINNISPTETSTFVWAHEMLRVLRVVGAILSHELNDPTEDIDYSEI